MVNRTEYTLTEEALDTFEDIHDSWEKEICEKNPTDALIGDRFYVTELRNSQFRE